MRVTVGEPDDGPAPASISLLLPAVKFSRPMFSNCPGEMSSNYRGAVGQVAGKPEHLIVQVRESKHLRRLKQRW